MYYEFYGMQEAPFNLNPDPRFLYLSETHKGALTQMQSGLEAGAGFMVLTGETGTGKTTLVRGLFQQLPVQVRTALLSHTILTAKGLLLNICRDFGIAFHARLRSIELYFALEDFLLENFHKGGSALLVIDEAHHVKPHMLEEIRLLSNIETNQQKLLQIMLVGQPELAVTLAQKELRPLHERVTVRYQLRNLSRQETEEYINHRLRVAGCETAANLFEADAVAAIYDHSGGIPRLINRLCENVLLMSYVVQSHTVTAAHVLKAQSQQSFGDEATILPPAGQEEGAPTGSSQDDAGFVDLLKGIPLWGGTLTTATSNEQDMPHDETSREVPAWSDITLDDRHGNSGTEEVPREEKYGRAARDSKTMYLTDLWRRFSIEQLLDRVLDIAASRSKLGSTMVLLVSLVTVLVLGFLAVLWLLNKI